MMGLSILFADDNPDQAMLCKGVFQRQDPTVRVLSVSQGRACLQAAHSDPPDLIFLDYRLPDMTGLDVLEKLRQMGVDVPVVMVTSQGDEQVAVEAMKRGAYDYIVKKTGYLRDLPTVARKAVETHRLRKQIHRNEQRYHMLHEFSLDIASRLDPTQLADRLVQGACALVRSDSALLALLPSETEERKNIVTCGGLEDAMRTWFESLDPGMFREGRPLRLCPPPKELGRPAEEVLIAVPLMNQKGLVGVLAVAGGKESSEWGAMDEDILFTLAVHATTSIENARLHALSARLAVTDALTGIGNHREFQRRLEEEMVRSKRYGREFSLLMADIDHFKGFNDSYGHPVGDEVLRGVAEITRGVLRTTDFAARYGGEEFGVILPETGTQGAVEVAERIRREVLERTFNGPGSARLVVTVSIGVATFPLHAHSRHSLVEAADRALYCAKDQGRNRVCVDGSGPVVTTPASSRRSVDPLRDLAETVDARSPYTRGHSVSVSRYCVLLAQDLGLGPVEIESLRLAGLLHHMGLASIPPRILNKPGMLTEEEVRLIQAHPQLPEMIFSNTGPLEMILPAILYHHERFDGKGYPRGLKGEEIPYLARLLAVVESYHAMRSPRPYRSRLSQEEALAQLERGSPEKFDPAAVAAFARVIRQQEESDPYPG